MTNSHLRALWLTGIAGATILAALPATAQEASVTKRVEKLEKEMRAVQRQVFPGGAPAFFEGEIGSEPATGTRTGPAASTPVADLTARVDALEAQLRGVTEQSEQNGFKLRELERMFQAYKAETDKRLAALEPPVEAPLAGPSETAAPTATPAVLTPRPAVAVTTTPAAALPRAATATPPAASAVRPTADRLARVKAVAVPATGNAVDDGYTYGYRLWEAKLFPEAQAQLKQVVDRNPRHRLASYAQNLLGRAYLDEGKPSLAAVAFYNNYNDRPEGERAPHSLMYMGVALDRLGRKADACKAFKELEEVYGDRAPRDVRTDAAAAKAKAGC